MMGAQHSIKILAWELSLSFGLTKVTHVNSHGKPSTSSWISLEDVLVEKAASGVKVRIIVWRHALLSWLNRWIYLGSVSIEAEVDKLMRRCKSMGISSNVFNLNGVQVENLEDPGSIDWDLLSGVDIGVIIVGSPTGLYLASHHEKLVLIDSECPSHSIAFLGGYDIARGRYDQPAHQIPAPMIPRRHGENKSPWYSGREGQPLIPMVRFLWHDLQVSIRGPACQNLSYHFDQRVIHAFTQSTPHTRSYTLIPAVLQCDKHQPRVTSDRVHSNVEVKLLRIWKGVYDTNYLFHEHCHVITSAKKFLYIEHQYPFHSYALCHVMCQTLRKNPNLRILIITPIKTDLPTGVLGEWVDWSQDHITQHLNTIKNTAPDRVGIYGLVRQDEISRKLKPIYVHTKLVVVDDEVMLTGSANMDNMSFFYSSELSVTIRNSPVAREARTRLIREHLGSHFQLEMSQNFEMSMDVFEELATKNHVILGKDGKLVGRPVSMVPRERYENVLKKIYYPNRITKMLYKLGMDTDVISMNDLWKKFQKKQRSRL
eukprot:TRINITY_DN5871_c0_g1_i2.p1 TRINITY_DN5871_c0_g1~~TRINITY_DN5871_c0_g1_i2.p1  ORF type:complete len:541 (+),score=138.32 TRINITY_DN5871_c0_g1_i2:1159-2781(+)